jgi:hypothetical protein
MHGLPLVAVLLAAPGPAGPAPAEGEEHRPWSLDLTVGDVGIGIGNSRHIDGLRLNFRDTAPFVAHGVNLTIWAPNQDGVQSEVDGIALGLPMTGAGTLRGLSLGFGVAADRTLDGIGLGVFGAGSGDRVRGILLGGLGAGAGGDVTGIAAGGLGAGAGGNVVGLLAGLLGAGCGGDLTGIALGGLGAGASGRLRGIAFGGLGAGAGGDVEGIVLGGLGVGAGGELRGLAVSGLGVGAGEAIRGIAVSAIGIGSPRIQGLTVSLVAGANEVQGLILAPAYFHLGSGGRFDGFAVSAFNRILGEQRGLVIGIVNYAARLNGVQIGLVNWADNNPAGLKILPIANAHFE